MAVSGYLLHQTPLKLYSVRSVIDYILKCRALLKSIAYKVYEQVVTQGSEFYVLLLSINRKAVNAFKRLAKLDQDYYPERMEKVGQLLAVNCNLMHDLINDYFDS